MAETEAHRRTPIAAAEPPKKVDPFKNVPEVVEERRRETDGSVSVNRYMKGALLGKGGFAQVFVSTSLPSKEKYALKIVAKSTLTKPRARQKLQTEINIHQALIHENVVRFLHCFEDPNYTYMILELCSNNVRSLFSCFPVNSLIETIQCIFCG
jgi:serine/threonine protein kinase